ncbi:MAG: hypothetical protein AAF196_07215 [Planctomycetota bacterium]
MFPRVLPAVLAGLSATLFSGSISAQIPADISTDSGSTQQLVRQSLFAPVTPESAWRVGPDGVAIVEIESVPPAPGWVLETDNPGWTGSGFYRWNGGNLFNSPGSGVLTYYILVDDPGTYAVRIHNRHNDPDPSEENDCWMSVNSSPWIKTFSNNGSNDNTWNWLLQFDPGFGAVVYPMSQGLNEIRISGRSQNFRIDRLGVWPVPGPNAQDLSLPQSERLRERPVLGDSMTIGIDDPLGDFGAPAGASITILIGSNEGPASGTLLPGFGLPGVGGAGEFLLDLSAPIATFLNTTAWNGNRIDVSFPIPNRGELAGLTLATQGVFLAPGSPAPTASFTNRLRLTLGNY